MKPCKRCEQPVKRSTNTFCSRSCSSIYSGRVPPSGKGKSHPRWKGGRIDRSGYTYIHKPEHPFSGKQGYVAEHRLIMEQHLGRLLVPGEVVHHKNHDRKDNRLENLELFESPGQHCLAEHRDALEKMWESSRGRAPWNKGIPQSEEAKRKFKETIAKRKTS